MDYKDFEKYGLSPEDILINIYKCNIMDADYVSGVEIIIKPFRLGVKCHDEKSQVKNKERCFQMLRLILDDMLKNS